MFKKFLDQVEIYDQLSIEMKIFNPEISFLALKKYLQLYLAIKNLLVPNEMKYLISLTLKFKDLKREKIDEFLKRDKGKMILDQLKKNIKLKIVEYSQLISHIDFKNFPNLKRIKNVKYLNIDLETLSNEIFNSFYYDHLNKTKTPAFVRTLNKLKQINEFERKFKNDLDPYVCGI